MIEPVLFKSGFGGSIGVIIFIVISLISWVINYASEQKKRQQRPQRSRPPQPPRVQQRRVPPQQQNLQNEIDLFLQKTGGRRRGAEPVIEIIPDDEFGNAHQRRRLSEEPEHSFASHLEDHHINEKHLGSGIQQHVTTHAGSDVLDFLVDQDMDDKVDENVQSHLGSFSGDRVSAHSLRPSTAEQIFQLFQTPTGVRQAVILQEVLNRRKFS